MFTPSKLFKSITCPEGERCQLLNCIFSHEQCSEQHSTDPVVSLKAVTSASPQTKISPEQEIEPPAKRRKVTYGRLEDKPPSRADLIRRQLAAERDGAKKDEPGTTAHRLTSSAQNVIDRSISTLERGVSPPLIASKSNISDPKQDDDFEAGYKTQWLALKEAGKTAKETLNPRMINPAPESHAKRVLYVQHIHTRMAKLNDEVRNAKKPVSDMEVSTIKLFVLNDQELIKLALDEEEMIARTKPKIYANVIRTCVATYQKMSISTWLEKLKSMSQADSFNEAAMRDGSTILKSIDTGLPTGQAHLILPHLVVYDQTPLKQYGYVTTPPSEAETMEAKAAVESCKNHEECDRCGSRFRLFPDRDSETGRFTSNGPCRYHYARKIFPSKQKTDSYTGSNEAMYPCCGQSLGTDGCTEHEDHVYKASAASRLAAVMPFINTPENTLPKHDSEGNVVSAVVFDCEMGYTTNGLELIRLTAVSWPEGKQLVDVLVRPLGAIIDLNTRFSGVTTEQMAKAEPHSGRSSNIVNKQPQIVENPAAARQLLCDFLTPTTPLIGHAIDNDLNATRLCHPAIIDTVLLFSHPRGLPFRYGLKMLAKKHLKRNIQTGGSAGHDSLEDAMATGDLVKFKASEMWSDMIGHGWKLENGKLINTSDDQACQATPGLRISSQKAVTAPKAMQGNRLAQILDEARSQDRNDKQESQTTDSALTVER